MKENCNKNTCRCDDTDGDFVQKNHSDAFLRVVEEKRELDERISKLKTFLDSFSEYRDLLAKVGSDDAADALREQLGVMVRYSNILNTRLVLWKD